MLAKNKSEALVRVGPGTPLGKTMRRYWHVIALSEELPDNDGPPLRTKLLGERFVIFRDTDGKVGVLDEDCPHRGVSLALGRNEEGGLRCLYHGWKFSAEGDLLETPNNPDCKFRERIKLRKYPVREQSGFIWTYIGPEDGCPPFRTWHYDEVAEPNRVVLKAKSNSSYLPLWEGGVDNGHGLVLHTNQFRPTWHAKARGEDVEVYPMSGPLEGLKRIAEASDFGFHYGYFDPGRGGGPGKCRAAVFASTMPNARIVPTGQNAYILIFEVPLDDFETATYSVVYGDAPVSREFAVLLHGYDSPLYDPKTYKVDLTWADNLGQDRSIMHRNWTGYEGIEIEDFAMATSMAHDYDREREHLVAADLSIVRLRQMLLQAIEVNEAGGDPIMLREADMTKIPSLLKSMDVDANWKEEVLDWRNAHATETTGGMGPEIWREAKQPIEEKA